MCADGAYRDMSIHDWCIYRRKGRKYVSFELEYFEGIDEIMVEIDYDDFVRAISEMINTGHDVVSEMDMYICDVCQHNDERAKQTGYRGYCEVSTDTRPVMCLRDGKDANWIRVSGGE